MTMPIPPGCESLPVSGVTTGAGWETTSISPDRTHVLSTGVATGAPGPDGETMWIPSDRECVSGTGGDTGDSVFARCYADVGILVEYVSSKTGAGFDVP